jgi:GcvH upstream region-like protein
LVLSQLLNHSIFDTDRSNWPHLLNDGVIEKNFLETGLAVMLAEQYFSYLEPELKRKEQIIFLFKPYTHPYDAQLSCRAVWKNYSPELLEHLEQLKRVDVHGFSTLCQLYLDQVAFPKEAMQQVLHFQEQRAGVPKDPRLAEIELSLFGFKNVKDWFGDRFIHLASQFILNVSSLAEQKKYQITKQEVQTDLLQNVYKGYKQLSQNKSLEPSQAMQYFQRELQVLGLNEADVINAWRHVMLFRRLVSDTSGSVFNDPLAQKQFHLFADQSIEVELYELPSYLRLKDFSSLLKLQVYLEAVSLEQLKSLNLPLEFASLDSIEAKQPALVQKKVEVRLSSINIEELAAQISLKSTWEWEATDEGWSFLQERFPSLKSSLDRRETLDKIDSRTSIDQAARLEMVRQNKELIVQTLQQRPLQTIELRLRKKPLAQGPYSSLLASEEFAAFLENAPLESVEECYSVDASTFYRIELIERDSQKELVGFEEAFQDGTLDSILDQQLENAYPKIRRGKENVFLQANGNFKPFYEVKEQIARILYEPLLLAIEQEYVRVFNDLPGVSKQLPGMFYSKYRLYGFMQSIKQQLELDVELNLPKQWNLISTSSCISRSQKLDFPTDDWVEIPINQWSPISVGSSGSLAFAKVCSKGNLEEVPLEKIEQGFQFLSFDTCRDVMHHLLQKIVEGNCIVFSDQEL